MIKTYININKFFEVLIIENVSIVSNSLGLLKTLPKEVFNKINPSNAYLAKTTSNEVEVVIIFGDNVDNISQSVDNLGGNFTNLGYNFGIVRIPVDKLKDLSLIKTIQYIEFPKDLYISDEQGNRASCVPQAISTYDVDGAGVLIGFIDTGIDYTHPAFLNEDGTTRIEYIYDLSEGESIYNKEQINEALKSTNPYSIVNSTDLVGHGTHVVGIACGGGRIEPKYYGVAPKASIAMVKVARSQFGLSTQVMRGIRFLIDKSKELQMPLVINISLSSNDGAHNGSSLFEQYIRTVATVERVSIVIAAGNEGEAAHHIGGNINLENEIYFSIGGSEKIIVLNLYKSILVNISIELVSPDGFRTGEVYIAQGYRSGTVGRVSYDIFYTGPKPFDLSGEIGIILTAANGFVSPGQWKVVINKLNIYEGNFDMWLPISEGLNVTTKFLDPTVDNTLGIPATVENVISVGSYNSLTNSISPFSGRGKPYNGQYIKPDVVAPGEDIYSSVPNKSFDRKSGTSMATPNVSGICALMMEWGIVKENDLYLYGERVKYYLIYGAKRGRSDISYPDPAWGYGAVCVNESLDMTTNELGALGNITRQDANQNQNQQVNNGNDDKEFYLIEVGNNEIFQKILDIPGITGIKLSDTFALILASNEELTEALKLANRLVNYLVPIFTLSDISPLDAADIPEITSNPYLRVNGRGVLVGIVDTGIDYLNNEFKREDDTSRIYRLWDQTLEANEVIQGIRYGREFTEEQITEAISLKNNGGDPSTVVPSNDEEGHGTMVAGLIGGRGINPDLKGVAPDCEFVIVKLANATDKEVTNAYIDSNVPKFSVWNILLGLRYISYIANQANRPVVIYIPLESNMGSHSGNGVIDTVINNVSRQVGTVVVTNTGNQGNSATHTAGVISKTGESKDIELRIGARQKVLPVQIWINQPNIVTLDVISPTGEVLGGYTSKNSRDRDIKFTYEGTEMKINFISPEISTGDTLINIGAKDLREGIWKFRLTGTYIVNGNYYAWIPQRELIDTDTKFLDSVEETTLTLPSAALSGISVAYYNQNNNSIVAESGKGYTRDNDIKPDIAAGGVNATVAVPGGGTKLASGASIAGAIVAGGCALILQWAIVDGNEKDIYAVQIKAYIKAGAKTRTGDIYPNRDWGYGMFNLQGVFDTIRTIYSAADVRKVDEYKEYTIGKLFIREPIDR